MSRPDPVLVLPKATLDSEMVEARRLEAEVAEQVYALQQDLGAIRQRIGILQLLQSKLVPMAPISQNGDDEDEVDAFAPTQLILDMVEANPGLTRDQIYNAVVEEVRKNSRTKDPRNLITNLTNRLVTKYKKLERVGERHYVAGTAPTGRDYDDFVAPALDDSEDDLPF